MYELLEIPCCQLKKFKLSIEWRPWLFRFGDQSNLVDVGLYPSTAVAAITARSTTTEAAERAVQFIIRLKGLFFGLMAPPWCALDFTHEDGTAGHFEALLGVNSTTLCSPFHLQNMQLISALSRA